METKLQMIISVYSSFNDACINKRLVETVYHIFIFWKFLINEIKIYDENAEMIFEYVFLWWIKS